METSGIDFYWLAQGNVAPPRGLAASNLRYLTPDVTLLPRAAIAFFEPAVTQLEKAVFHVRAKYGAHFYLIVIVGADELGKAPALLERGADDVCTRALLEHPELVVARATRQVTRQATNSLPSEIDRPFDFIKAGIDALPIPIFFKDDRGAYLGCNEAFSQSVRRSAAEIVGKTVYETAHPDTAEAYAELDRQLLEGGGVQIFESSHRFNDGLMHDAAVVKAVFRNEQGRVAGFAGAMLDITDRIKAQQLLQQREQEFRTLVENSPDGIARYDRSCRRVYINPALERTLGPALEALGRSPTEVTAIVDAEQYTAKLRRVLGEGVELSHQGAVRRAGGNIGWTHVRLVPEFGSDGRVESVLAIARDITEVIESRDKIRHLAYFDPLTGLPNRANLNERIQQLGSDAGEAQQRQFGLMLLDLDGFKEVNDALGHAAGDALLADVAARLTARFAGPATVARLGGDEFAVALPGNASKGTLSLHAASILHDLAQPFRISGHELRITTSIGIARCPADSADFEILLKQADAAMYHAKRVGRNNFQFYDREMTERIVERMAIAAALRRAREQNELELHYQPIIALPSGEWVGAEALLRWNHPELGLLMPNKFIGIAEETGLIVDIGRWVLFEACRAATEWREGCSTPLRISVNLSSRQFLVNDLVSAVREALLATRCQATWLELEITESLLLEDNDHVHSMLRELSALGLSIAIDDFGTGYSALGYLTRFPIDTLKIDRSFMRDMDVDPKRPELMKAIIGIAKALGLRLIAEGVETREQADFLVEKGCLLAQGFLYGHPMPRGEFVALLRAGATRSAPSPESGNPTRAVA
jgi:diguanylate cyclase (GGDEF)-like protein/PAS domain S-box-containing protein